MPFQNITRLTHRTTIQSTYYFLDANVWIYALQSDDWMENWQHDYSEFFYDILDSELDDPPKILMPSILFSEILNTYLRRIAMPEYMTQEEIGPHDAFTFKKDYRPTQHYRDNYDQLCDDIKSYKVSIHFMDDSLIISNNPEFLNPAIDPFDFNDYFFYLLCREFQKNNPIVVVTNDGDFQVEDIPIITKNRDLLNLKS
jgi:predicted nucleic acid-binding protein